jgi:hypothetical protein
MLDHGLVHAIGSPEEVVYELRYVLLRRDPNFVPEEGTREAEIASVELIRADGSTGRPVVPGEDLTIQVDARANELVDALDASFAIHDADNQPVVVGRTGDAGLDVGPFTGKKRIVFTMRALPLARGKYWVTVGLRSAATGRLYHVQTQRYWFEVHEPDEAREPVDVRYDVAVEDL